MVRRPINAPKQKSKLRISFDPGENAEGQDAIVPAPTRVKPKAPVRAAEIEDRDRKVDRPNYSKSYLDELKGSTPSTPKDLSAQVSSAEDDDLAVIQPQTQALDTASKFGTSSASGSSAIPSASEIAEKKARRERLAKESQAAALTTSGRNTGSVRNQDDFVSLDAFDSDGEFKPSRLQVSTYIKDDKAADEMEYTRLVPEDEDIAEGFEHFLEDQPAGHQSKKSANRINMSMKQDPKRERDAMRDMIEVAEGASGEESEESGSENSDASAEHAYMTAQTRHGAGFSHLSKEERRRQDKEAQRPKQPEKTTPVPTLAASLGRLRELKEAAELNKTRAQTRKVEIERRLKEVEVEKTRIQSALEDLGRQLEEANQKVTNQEQNGSNGMVTVIERGLDSIGGQAKVD